MSSWLESRGALGRRLLVYSVPIIASVFLAAWVLRVAGDMKDTSDFARALWLLWSAGVLCAVLFSAGLLLALDAGLVAAWLVGRGRKTAGRQ